MQLLVEAPAWILRLLSMPLPWSHVLASFLKSRGHFLFPRPSILWSSNNRKRGVAWPAPNEWINEWQLALRTDTWCMYCTMPWPVLPLTLCEEKVSVVAWCASFVDNSGPTLSPNLFLECKAVVDKRTGHPSRMNAALSFSHSATSCETLTSLSLSSSNKKDFAQWQAHLEWISNFADWEKHGKCVDVNLWSDQIVTLWNPLGSLQQTHKGLWIHVLDCSFCSDCLIFFSNRFCSPRQTKHEFLNDCHLCLPCLWLIGNCERENRNSQRHLMNHKQHACLQCVGASQRCVANKIRRVLVAVWHTASVWCHAICIRRTSLFKEN